MSYERLIAEHARIEVKVDGILALIGSATPDVDAVVRDLACLSSELGEHLAHEDSYIYPKMIAAENTEMSETASSFTAEFATLNDDWGLYIDAWNGETIKARWPDFLADTRSILKRLSARVAAENDLLYPAALQNGVLSLRAH